MATINGPVRLIWTGTQECSKTSLYNYKDSVSRVYNSAQNGLRFNFQIPRSSQNIFADINDFECGTGYLLFISSSAINIPSSVEALNTQDRGRVRLNFPKEIRIQNLSESYFDANGEYHLTTYFANNSPTYKQLNNNWTIEKRGDGKWYITNRFSDLSDLRNESGSPTSGFYELPNCNLENCPTGFANELGSPSDTTPPNKPVILTAPQSPTNSDNLEFTWESSDDDVTFFKIKINNDNIRYVSSETTSFSFSPIEGMNIFRILASDGYGNESEYTEDFVEVDTTPPNKPVINAPDSPISTNILSFTWTGDSDVVKYEYKFNSESWTEISATESLLFTGSAILGNNTFKVKAFDVVGNVSDESNVVINVLDAGIPAPVLSPVSSPTTAKILKFTWTSSGTFTSYNFRFNTSTWTSLASDQTEFIGTPQQGLNFFEIRTVDQYGNNSEIARTEVFVDSVAPNAPVFVSQPGTITKQDITFSWQSDSDVSRYYYSFNNSSWTELSNINSIILQGKQGNNLFLLKAADQLGNESEISRQNVTVNIADLDQPTLFSPESPRTDRNLEYSWTHVETATEYHVRFNDGSWQVIAIDDRTYSAIGVQGENKFELRATDNNLVFSPILSVIVIVDSIPPPAPILVPMQSPTSNTTLVFRWNANTDSVKYLISFNDSSWQEVNAPTTSISLPANQGNNVFKIKALDIANNESEIVTETIFVDSVPPDAPNLLDPSKRLENNITYLTYTWTYSSTEVSYIEYKFNDSVWINIAKNNQVELPAIEGTNIFQIRLFDALGNGSPITTKETTVDSEPPPTPAIEAPYGICPENVWQDLWTACQRSNANLTTNITITYSFMRSGTIVGYVREFASQNNVCKPLQLSNISTQQFILETEAAFQHWKELIEFAFPKVNITFQQLGFEDNSDTNFPSATAIVYPSSASETIGDIRIGVYDIFDADALGEAILPKSIDNPLCNKNGIKYKSGAGDVRIDYEQSWRLDSESNNAMSLMYVLVHEIGHSLGLQHITVNGSVMHPNVDSSNSIRTDFPNGLKNSAEDVDLFHNTYSFPSKADKNIKVITIADSIKIDWKSDEDSMFEWKYNILNKYTNGIIFSGNWNSISTPSNTGSVEISKNYDHNNNDIEFFVRSIDNAQNKSDTSNTRIRMIDFPENASILSVKEVCDNSIYKHKDNCWDTDGEFTAEFTYSVAKTSNQQLILRRWKPQLHDFTFEAPILDADAVNTMTTNALSSNSEYEFQLSLKNSGENLRLVSNETYASNIGVLYSDPNNSLKLTTSTSDIESPPPVQIATPEHYENTSSAYKRPTGERQIDGVWKPACSLRWSESNASDFKEYNIFYSENADLESFDTSHVTGYTVTTGKSVTTSVISLPKYNTKYYIGILVMDTHGNPSTLSKVEYTTVPYDAPPKIVGDALIYYTNSFGVTKYNERPGLKWTLLFSLPFATDSQYPSDHSTPDTEIPYRNDYTNSDWMSTLGHMPYRIECDNWPFESGNDGVFTGFFINPGSESAESLGLTYNSSTSKYEFSMAEWEADTTYNFKYIMYDTNGHSTTYDFSVTTNSKPADYTAPAKPTALSATPINYLNGKWLDGSSNAELQWRYEFSWTSVNENDINLFELWMRKVGENWDNINISVNNDKLTKVVNGNTTTYTGPVSGFQTNTNYEFYLVSIDTAGNASYGTDDVQFTTPIGDQINPPLPLNFEIERQGLDRMVYSFNIPLDPDINYIIVRLSEDLGSTDYWSWPIKLSLSSELLSDFNGNIFVYQIQNLTPNATYRYCVHTFDTAYNWSTPLLGTIDLSQSSVNAPLVETININENINFDKCENLHKPQSLEDTKISFKKNELCHLKPTKLNSTEYIINSNETILLNKTNYNQ